MKAYRAQTVAELRLMLRQAEQLLVSLGIPLSLLGFFTTVDVLPSGDREPVDFLTPGILALALMGSAMVSLGIGTGFERQYGVLKRLGATPLGRPRLVAAKTTMVLLVVVLQAIAVTLLATALGWDPDVAPVPVVAGVALGTVAFAGLGLVLAGRLPGLVNLAATNGLYLVLLLAGGLVFPLDELPDAAADAASLTPAAALADVLRAGMADGTTDGGALAVLAVWAVGATVTAAALFRWD